jgi:hypothetical protein
VTHRSRRLIAAIALLVLGNQACTRVTQIAPTDPTLTSGKVRKYEIWTTSGVGYITRRISVFDSTVVVIGGTLAGDDKHSRAAPDTVTLSMQSIRRIEKTQIDETRSLLLVIGATATAFIIGAIASFRTGV